MGLTDGRMMYWPPHESDVESRPRSTKVHVMGLAGWKSSGTWIRILDSMVASFSSHMDEQIMYWYLSVNEHCFMLHAMFSP